MSGPPFFILSANPDTGRYEHRVPEVSFSEDGTEKQLVLRKGYGHVAVLLSVPVDTPDAEMCAKAVDLLRRPLGEGEQADFDRVRQVFMIGSRLTTFDA